MRILLSVKHWHLFVLTFGIQVILKFISFNIDYVANYWVILQAFGVSLAMVVFFSWLWSIVTVLAKRKNVFFTISIALIAIDSLITLLTILFFNTLVDVLLPPLSIVTLISIVYSVLFAAKALKSIELHRETNSSEYMGDFLLLLMFPVGVWFVQPRVNKAWLQRNNTSE